MGIQKLLPVPTPADIWTYANRSLNIPSTFETIGLTPATTEQAVVVSGGVAHTKGAYVQLVAASAAVCKGFTAFCARPSGVPSQFYLDIALGAGGAEVVLVPDIPFSFVTNQTVSFYIDARINAGTRISARVQANGISTQLRVSLALREE